MNFLVPSRPTPPPVVNGCASNAQSRPGITTTVETITPDVARQYLAVANPNNRNVAKSSTVKYGLDMKEGRWTLNGQPIIFDETGMLVDGHHRLTAAIEHNATFSSVIVRGVPSSAITSIDGGRGRSAADMAKMESIPNAKTACSITTLILVNERFGIEFITNSSKLPSKAETLDSVRKNPYIQICVNRATSVKDFLPLSVAGFCWYVFQFQDRQRADRFFDELSSGANLSQDNPAYMLREKLGDLAKKSSRTPNLHLIALTFKAWIAYRDGKKIKLLRWTPDGPNPERFPVI